MTLRSVQRDLYMAQRALGDVQAAKRGPKPLARRLTKRVYHRKLIGLLRRGGIW
ncbi:MAG TPA: hypothetical protein VHZ96_26350 [Frankiaceae bacterium]|jgi:hypothetical protein|nr:hypothetical protein [Frankiaceae bacterium]